MSAATRVKLRADAPPAWRRGAALGLMGVFAMAVLARAFYLQVVDKDFLTHEGDKRAVRTLVLQADRGAIRDRYGAPLALSAPVDSVWVLPSELLAAEPYVVAMAKMLGESPAELRQYLDRSEEHTSELQSQ